MSTQTTKFAREVTLRRVLQGVPFNCPGCVTPLSIDRIEPAHVGWIELEHEQCGWEQEYLVGETTLDESIYRTAEICKQHGEKLWHDRKSEYFCPFCET